MRYGERCVFVAVLLGTCGAAAAALAAGTAPAQGPIVAVDPPVLSSAALGSPQAVSAVWNGKEIFAVWNDWRDPQQSNVFGMRVTSDGKVVDPSSLLVTPGWDPVVAWDGSNYLLVHGESGAGAYTDLVARRLGANGQLLDSQRQVLTTKVDPPYRVLWTGSEYAVFWDDERSEFGGRTLMARLKQDGTLIATDLPVFTSGLVNQGSAAMPVAWSGSSYLLVWRMTTGPVAQLLSPQGAPVGAPITVGSQTYSEGEPTVSSDGTNFYVAWWDGSVIKGARVSPGGQLVDATPVQLATASAVLYPHLNWTGSEYVFDFLGRSSTTQLVRISAAGLPLGSSPLSTAAIGGQWAELVPTPDRLMLISSFVQAPAGYWMKTDGSAMALAPTPLCVGANRQRRPALAWNGSSYLAVWYDDRVVGRVQIRGQILDGNGRPRLDDSFLIVESADVGVELYQMEPSRAAPLS